MSSDQTGREPFRESQGLSNAPVAVHEEGSGRRSKGAPITLTNSGTLIPSDSAPQGSPSGWPKLGPEKAAGRKGRRARPNVSTT